MNLVKLSLTRIMALAAVLYSTHLTAQTPEWIWFDNNGKPAADNEVRFFRKTFTPPENVAKAIVFATADNECEIFVNGQPVVKSQDWHRVGSADVTKLLKPGQNVIAAKGKNVGVGAAALLVKLDFALKGGPHQLLVTDTTWRVAAAETPGWKGEKVDESQWQKVVSFGKLGIEPWGNIMAAPEATPAVSLQLLPGFKAELLRSADVGEGSWICMTVDSKGRLIVSPQGNESMLRITLSESGQIAKIETIDLPVGSAMGLLYTFDSLYVSGRGPEGLALYRLRDTTGNDKYDKIEMLRKFDGAGGEHGSHAVLRGPDDMLYDVNGNFVKVPKDVSPNSPHKNYADDQLLPRANDGNGFGNGILPPGGYVARMDPDAKNVQLFAAGTRNTYDIAFSPDGELFGFDSDMEWDWGTPWYRPIRIYHIVSGGDYGFREGSGKWPTYYQDSLPPTLNIGIGSPTGMKFGTGSKYPAKYQQALFAMDWTYGRIFAVHLTPKGASYSATAENFVRGKPLNVTDFEFGKDGAMYFLTGGRGTQSGLYRISYVGNESTAPVLAKKYPQAIEARALRHQLEAFHGKPDPKAVEFAWPHLNSEDRFIRYAARIAIESQPVTQWKDRALAETKPNGGLTALLALARLGGKETQRDLLLAMKKFPLDQLSEEQKLIKLRALELSFIRQGRPDPDLVALAIEKLDAQYPAKSEWLNRELAILLIYLEAPDAVAKTLKLAAAAPTQEEQIHYLHHLRKAKGWTLDQRKQYFEVLAQKIAAVQNVKYFEPDYPGTRPGPMPISNNHADYVLQWFKDADRPYGDGSSFQNFVTNIRRDAIESLSPEERAQLAPLLTAQTTAPAKALVARKFVKDWKMDDLLPALDQISANRSFQRGQDLFTAAQCIACHRFGNAGGAVGPDLTAVSSRFARRDILESIILPSKVISEQFQNMTLFLKDGEDVSGRIVEENNDKVILVVDALNQTKAEVKKSDIKSRAPSKISSMPEGLVSTLTKDEILDLMAYMESAGNASHADFKKK